MNDKQLEIVQSWGELKERRLRKPGLLMMN